MRPVWARKDGVNFLYRFVLLCFWSFMKFFYRSRVYGLENWIGGKAIIASNHISYIDPPLVAVSSPDPIHFVAKEDLFKSLFGKFISALNAHPIKPEASNIQVMKMLCSFLNRNQKILIFPEGGRSFDNELQPLQKGMALISSRTQAPIIPTYLTGAYEIWKRGQKRPKIFGKVACVFGKPIYWEEFASMEKKEAMAALTKRVYQSLKELRKWYESGAKGIPP